MTQPEPESVPLWVAAEVGRLHLSVVTPEQEPPEAVLTEVGRLYLHALALEREMSAQPTTTET